ncbi:MAG TPA: chemotaxis-specific protein-glutamate methyltransferase CheB [Solirubrobacteraceae bacterium]|nr:chemotaxis-specific protein-glutamate methyltransferase CheB [Solirubrobacteraceae bacterium]
MIRALVVEDSAVSREYLCALLETDPAITVVGTARDGAEGIERTAELRPDVIVMDVHMPRLDGYEASRRIMEKIPTPIVMTSATLSEAELRDGFRALEAGALTLLRKPGGPDDAGAGAMIEAVRLMAEIKVVRRWMPRARPALAPPPEPPAMRTPRVVAIGASTGGPPVVANILRGLPRGFGCPVLLVQHMSGEFSAGFADWLQTLTPLRVKLAEAAEPARAGTVYVAAGGAHLGIDREGRIALEPPTAGNGFCPSVSRLFGSVADAFGAASVGVLLTGMGRDGAEGLRRLREAGALTIAQDAETSAVFGMPAEAVRLEAAALVLPPEEIARTIATLATRSAVR